MQKLSGFIAAALIRVQRKANVCKLQIAEHGVLIKIEVNMVGRGLIPETTKVPLKVPLCDTAQEQFDVFCAMPLVSPLVSLAQLYGGKICAALDRPPPRDLKVKGRYLPLPIKNY